MCAEKPSEIEQPYLFSLVLKHMMHGPCGLLNPKNVCMNQKKECKNHYPKEFSEYTKLGEDCYPTYKRTILGTRVIVRRKELDNRWVVPYNPMLLARFNCHLNVEVC